MSLYDLYILSSQGFHVSPVVNGTVRHRLFAQPEGDGVQLLQPFIVYFFVHGGVVYYLKRISLSGSWRVSQRSTI